MLPLSPVPGLNPEGINTIQTVENSSFLGSVSSILLILALAGGVLYLCYKAIKLRRK